jgi:hypothetical protein
MRNTRATGRFSRLLGIVALLLVTQAIDAQAGSSGSGIEGSAKISPIHGGPIKLGELDSASLANTAFVVESAAGVIATFKTDEQGNFKVDLPPGRYSIRTKEVGIKGRGCGLSDIEVTAGSFKKVQVECDSGMR